MYVIKWKGNCVMHAKKHAGFQLIKTNRLTMRTNLFETLRLLFQIFIKLVIMNTILDYVLPKTPKAVLASTPTCIYSSSSSFTVNISNDTVQLNNEKNNNKGMQ